MKKTLTSVTTSALMTAMALALGAGCDQPEPEDIGTKTNAIFHGYVIPAANVGPLGIVKVAGPAGDCTGTIYSQYWVLTSAHCIAPVGNKAVITLGDGAANYRILNVIDRNGGLATHTAYSIHRHPNATFGSNAATDIAMIFMNPSGHGADTSRLYPEMYTSGKLHLYQGTTNPGLINGSLLAYGYGPTDSSGTSGGSLNGAWKIVSSVFPDWYQATTWNGGGTSCGGDSGGPDFIWTGSRYEVTGVHAGYNGMCNGGIDSEPGVEQWRTWVYDKGSTCATTTVSGFCHF